MAGAVEQVMAVTAMNLRTVPSRLGASMVIVVGIAGVVGVLVALLAMAEGFRATLTSTGRADRVLVLRGGANDELSSVIYRSQVPTIEQAPGVARDADGRPLATAEVFMLTSLPRRGATAPTNVVVRGTGPNVLAVRPEVHLVEGRLFRTGVREIVAGRGAAREFAGLTVGQVVPVRGGDWTVVGVFESGGNVHESEIWADGEALMSSANRGAPTSVVARLESADALPAFRDALAADPTMTVDAVSEPRYYASRSEKLARLINGLGYFVAGVMAVGALFGALNTMYAAVSTRSVEIATLRAIGFTPGPVVVSVMIESLLLALAGGVLGALIAYALFNGYTVSTLNGQTFSQVAFDFRVTPALLAQGVLWSVVIGAVGGFFPALRAARVPVVEALRAS
ncbi:MAG: ABC transporter permease [Panacagrimonas sp.]